LDGQLLFYQFIAQSCYLLFCLAIGTRLSGSVHKPWREKLQCYFLEPFQLLLTIYDLLRMNRERSAITWQLFELVSFGGFLYVAAEDLLVFHYTLSFRINIYLLK
jgi:hypothetical protein